MLKIYDTKRVLSFTFPDVISSGLTTTGTPIADALFITFSALFTLSLSCNASSEHFDLSSWFSTYVKAILSFRSPPKFVTFSS